MLPGFVPTACIPRTLLRTGEIRQGQSSYTPGPAHARTDFSGWGVGRVFGRRRVRWGHAAFPAARPTYPMSVAGFIMLELDWREDMM